MFSPDGQAQLRANIATYLDAGGHKGNELLNSPVR